MTSVNHVFYILMLFYSSFLCVHFRIIEPYHITRSVFISIERYYRKPQKVRITSSFQSYVHSRKCTVYNFIVKCDGADDYPNNPYKESVIGLPANRHVFNDWRYVQKRKLNWPYVRLHILEPKA
jgi:hypothetical protein